MARALKVEIVMRSVSRVVLAFTFLAAATVWGQQPGVQTDRPTFRSRVDRVAVSAVVRDQKGRLVTNLQARDFQILDSGRPAAIMDFRADLAPVTLALLIDASGSMQLSGKDRAARAVADQVLAWLEPGRDEVTLLSFDKRLRQLHGFTSDLGRLSGPLAEVEPWGLTSLHDAIAAAARSVAERGRSHRGVVVLTDGLDTSSRLTPPEVSGIASSIDVPVYIVTVLSPLDDPDSGSSVVEDGYGTALRDLADWTGGRLFTSSAPSHASVAARRIVEELRHQYLLAFEPVGKAGWHPVEVRVRDKNLTVRARGGYYAGRSL
ncbi:MAG: VWA domain-containing protein [Vicinamibacterales bacterium]